MTWNYRVVKRKILGEGVYEIREVHYDGTGEVDAWIADAIDPGGLTKGELRRDLELMLEALDRPALNLDKLEKKLARRAAK